MKKKQLEILKEIGLYFFLILTCLVMFYVGYLMYESYRDGTITIENISGKFAKEHSGEKYSHSSPINEEEGIAFIDYNCADTFVWDCHGQYYVFLNKIDGHWQINESSKTIIW